MKLKNAARLFDTCPVYDAYSGALLFKVQGSTFLENSAEGNVSARRIISADPAIVFPVHSCILALGDLILVGEATNDEWAGGKIRTAYWTKRITDSFNIFSPAQAALNTGGSVAYGQRKFLRETINTQTDSELDPMWDISLSRSLTVERGYFFKSGTTLYRARMVYRGLDGFLTCQSDEIDSPRATVSFTSSSSYDPIADTYAPVAVNTTGIFIDVSKAFTRETQAEFALAPGDASLVVAKSAIIAAHGLEFSVGAGHKFSGSWRVINYISEGDGWNLHVRRR